MEPLAQDLHDAASAVDPTRVSNTKWAAVESVLAEALGEPEEQVYAATVSKSGNRGVRLGQSPEARTAGVAVAMFTGASNDVEPTLRGAVAHFEEEDRRLFLLFAERAGRWTLEAIVKPADAAVPSPVASAWPTAAVIDV